MRELATVTLFCILWTLAGIASLWLQYSFPN